MPEKSKKLYHNVIDLTGMTFSQLTVISFSHSNHNGAYWTCLCVCGVKKLAGGSDLRRGNVKSCGCYVRSNNSKLGRARVGSLSPRWINDRDSLLRKNKCKKFMRKQVSSLLKNRNGLHSHEVLGYTGLELVSHLEKQFDEKMNWENYGTYWHIDHIVPISYFTSQGVYDPKVINCLTNLQPLEAKENIRKSNRYVG